MKQTTTVSEFPHLLEEWDYERNSNVSPTEISYGNNRLKVWWKCSKGHSWQSTVANRYHGNRCPYCSGKKVIAGETDLESQRPDLMTLWDYSQDIHPSEISQHSGRYATWICPNNHSWKAKVRDVVRKTRCPVCANRLILAGFNDLRTIRPDLIEEWDFEKNGDLQPEMVAPSAKRRIWWICKNGHSWKTQVYNRYNGTKCPYCSGNRPVSGVNDLVTMRPELISEWCYELNDIAPDKVTVYSNRKVWWRCRHNHRWKAVIYERTVTGTGCPYCCGKKTVPGKTDLLTLYPELSQEWDYQMNVNVDPKYIRPSSGKAVWWKCKNGHKWKAQVNMRTSGRGCPYCSGKTPVHASLI